MPSISAKTVLFIVFPDVKLLDLTGPMQVFADTQDVCEQRYDIVVASHCGGAVTSDAVLPVATTALDDLHDLDVDTVIIAGGTGAFSAAEDRAFMDEVRLFAGKARRIGSVCTGAFILARAGVLTGRRAVTHWNSCDLFTNTFGDIIVDPDAIYVTDGNVWTSGGVTAGIDMCLGMVAQDAGREAAMSLAHALVCYLVRPGGQSQFSTTLRQQSQSSSGRFDSLDAWIADNLAGDLSVENLARQAAMSPRNFARLYKANTGISPAKSVEAIRLNAARRMLEETTLPLAHVVRDSGFQDDERLRRAMMRAFKVAPGEYRQRFGRRQI